MLLKTEQLQNSLKFAHSFLVIHQLRDFLLLLAEEARLNQAVQLSSQDCLERYILPKAVVRHSIVFPVISTNFFRPPATSNLSPPLGGIFGNLLFQLHGIQLASQQFQGHFLVLQLAALLRAENADARRVVAQVDGGLNLVHVLPPSASTSRFGPEIGGYA